MTPRRLIASFFRIAHRAIYAGRRTRWSPSTVALSMQAEPEQLGSITPVVQRFLELCIGGRSLEIHNRCRWVWICDTASNRPETTEGRKQPYNLPSRSRICAIGGFAIGNVGLNPTGYSNNCRGLNHSTAKAIQTKQRVFFNCYDVPRGPDFWPGLFLGVEQNQLRKAFSHLYS